MIEIDLCSLDPELPSPHLLTPSSAQRLKHVRRVESAHAPSGAKTSKNPSHSLSRVRYFLFEFAALITPDSWRTEPVLTKKATTIAQPEKSSKKPKTTIEILNKRSKTDLEEPISLFNQRSDKVLKAKRDTSSYRSVVCFHLENSNKQKQKKKNVSILFFSFQVPQSHL